MNNNKTILGALVMTALTSTALAQVGDGNQNDGPFSSSTNIAWTVGALIVGVVIGYLIGAAKAKK